MLFAILPSWLVGSGAGRGAPVAGCAMGGPLAAPRRPLGGPRIDDQGVGGWDDTSGGSGSL